MSHSQNHHFPPQKPPSSPPQNHSYSPFLLSLTPASVTSESVDSIFTFDDDFFDAQAQQQLISNLLSSPSHDSNSTTSFHPQVKFVSYPYYLPLSPSFDGSSYVTINGNEETCGSSFSDTCSFMASFDTCGVRFPDGVFNVQNDVVSGGGFDGMLKSRDDNDDGDGDGDVWDWSEFLDEVRF